MPARVVTCSRLVVACLLAGAVPCACSSDPTQGYSFHSSHDKGISSVNVVMFQNPTYYRGVEVELTDAIIKQIQAATPWKVTSASDAQTSLTGKITDVRMNRLSTSGKTGYIQELDYQVTIEFTWKDNRTGKILVSKRNFAASDTFAPAQPVGERIESGEHGAVQRLAQDLVSAMRSNW